MEHYFDNNINSTSSQGFELNYMSQEDFSNGTFSAEYTNNLKHCHENCPFNDCYFESTYTTTLGIEYEDTSAYITLPDKPSFSIKYKVYVLFVDTITSICSALGLWFRFSIYGMNILNFRDIKLDYTHLKAEIQILKTKNIDMIRIIHAIRREPMRYRNCNNRDRS